MTRLSLLLETSWFALALLAVAAFFIVRVALARGRSVSPWSAAFVVFFGGLGLGGLFLANIKYDLFNYQLTVGETLLAVAFMLFLGSGSILVFGRAWSFWVGLGLALLITLGLGAVLVRPTTAGIHEAVRSVRWLEFVRPEWLGLLFLAPLAAFVGTGPVNRWARGIIAFGTGALLALVAIVAKPGDMRVVYIVIPVMLALSGVFFIVYGWLGGRSSLAGLGPTRKWMAIGARVLGIAAMVMALAEPRIRRPSEHVTVLFVVDRSFSVPQDLDPDRPPTEPLDRRWLRSQKFIEDAVSKRGPTKRNDQAGLILFGKRPKLALPPAAVDRMPVDERMAGPIDGNYTDIAAAIKLALASFPEGTSKRIVLISDGNENIGNAEEQANLAKENGVQIDTVALAPGFRNESEVLVQAVEAPPVTAQGQRLPVRVLVRNATPDRIVVGRLELFKSTSGETANVEIEESFQLIDRGPPPKVQLMPGLNVFRFRDRIDPQGDTAFAYRATFTPTESRPAAGGPATPGLAGDRTANNRAATAVVSRGQRRVLFLDEAKTLQDSPHRHLIQSLRVRGNIQVLWRSAENLPAEKGELGVFLSNFDCLVIANVPYDRFSGDQAEMIRSSVYDQGCGLIMIGGPDSFGPGGYQGSPIEAALPVDCEIKALKAAGKGGLVLIMHASEMADGNSWQKQIAKLAIERLGPSDMVGVVQYGFGGGQGVNWHIPFQEIGEDKGRLKAKVDSMMPGDMPDFDPFLRAAADTLADPKHNLSVRHCILISDGDPNYSGPGIKAVADMAANAVTCTTVGVATHGGAEKSRLKQIAEGTKDGNGKPGNFYDVSNPAQLPAIYIKESRRVSQSFIYDKQFKPTIVGGGGTSDVLAPGLSDLPDLHGFVRTTLKENILAGMSIEGPTVFDQRFPVLASWRYGLGKAVAFTSDARTQPGDLKQWWDRDWVKSDLYQKFWEQLVNWSMREAERGKLTLVTEYRDGRVRITADVRDEKDKPVTGLSLRGGVTLPNAPPAGEKPPAVEFKPKGGGIYEAEFPAEEAGSYFVNVNALEPVRDLNGNVVLGPDGRPMMKTFDAARAGVTVPYSPEFADLESNTPMMKRLAELTGGQFHTESSEDLQEWIRSGEIFREAKNTTRALLPFWFWLVFAAAVLLLVDVCVRRIALEWGEVRFAALRFWGGLRRKDVVDEESAGLDKLLRRKAATVDVLDRGRATRKFDPTTTSVADPAPAGADEYASRAATGPPIATPIATRPERAEPVEDDAFEKLRKAKERAKHQRQKRDDEPDRS